MTGMAGMELVSPDKFNPAQKQYIEALTESVRMVSEQTDLVFGFKDIHSRHIAATDAFATQCAGLPRGMDAVGRLDHDMPCEGIVELADTFRQEDQELMQPSDIFYKKSFITITNFHVGLQAHVCDKYPILHAESNSVLGVTYAARKIEISNFLMLLPDYFFQFGMGCSIENTTGPLSLGDAQLTEYEHEVAFLTAVNWDAVQIAHFMDTYRPNADPRSGDTIYKCKNRIAEKLSCHPSDLRDLLIKLGIHQRMPATFFKRLTGSWAL